MEVVNKPHLDFCPNPCVGGLGFLVRTELIKNFNKVESEENNNIRLKYMKRFIMNCILTLEIAEILEEVDLSANKLIIPEDYKGEIYSLINDVFLEGKESLLIDEYDKWKSLICMERDQQKYIQDLLMLFFHRFDYAYLKTRLDNKISLEDICSDILDNFYEFVKIDRQFSSVFHNQSDLQLLRIFVYKSIYTTAKYLVLKRGHVAVSDEILDKSEKIKQLIIGVVNEVTSKQ